VSRFLELGVCLVNTLMEQICCSFAANGTHLPTLRSVPEFQLFPRPRYSPRISFPFWPNPALIIPSPSTSTNPHIANTSTGASHITKLPLAYQISLVHFFFSFSKSASTYHRTTSRHPIPIIKTSPLRRPGVHQAVDFC
jgi:hypothetical protein